MLDKIAPGSKIQIKVTSRPTNVSAAKTIVKILSKDPTIQAENKRLRKTRDKNLVWANRGGRHWGVRHPKQRPVVGAMGEIGTLTATVDVLTELKSVSRFIEVSKAR